MALAAVAAGGVAAPGVAMAAPSCTPDASGMRCAYETPGREAFVVPPGSGRRRWRRRRGRRLLGREQGLTGGQGFPGAWGGTQTDGGARLACGV
jgi:hypothetical protein